MRLRLLLTPIFLFFATMLFAQSATDTTRENLDPIFTRVEIKPSFKGGDEALNKYLNEAVNTNDANNGETGMLFFIVSAKGNVYEAKAVTGNLSFQESLKNALSNSSGMWNSALQNNYHVHAYCRLKVTFRKGKIWTEIE